MSSPDPANAGAFSSVGAFITAISDHIGRALRVRMPVLKAVMELSEREVFAVGELVQLIRRESTRHVTDFERIHRELGDEASEVGASGNTLAQSLRALNGAQQFSASLSRTLNQRMIEHGRLARMAATSAKQIVDIAIDVSQIGSTAALVTLHAQVEADKLGPLGSQFAMVVQQLRELTQRMERSGQQIVRLGHDLIRTIPEIAEHATAMQESHAEATQMLDQRLLSVRAAQHEALKTTGAAVQEGRSRADHIVRQLHELSARLQFQDSIAQDLTAILNQELASTKLVQWSLSALPDKLPDRAQFEAEAKRAEHLSHSFDAEERARQADHDDPDQAQLEQGEDVFF